MKKFYRAKKVNGSIVGGCLCSMACELAAAYAFALLAGASDSHLNEAKRSGIAGYLPPSTSSHLFWPLPEILALEAGRRVFLRDIYFFTARNEYVVF